MCILTMQAFDEPAVPCETQDTPPRRLEEKRLPVVWSNWLGRDLWVNDYVY